MLKFIKWVRLHWLGYLFKVKNILPESPSQEVKTSGNDTNIILQALEEGSKAKQEKEQWFTKANDLREAVFDLNPYWDNHQVYMENVTLDMDDYRPPAQIREVRSSEPEPKFADDVPTTCSPWDDFKKNPIKNHKLTQEEKQQMQTEDNNAKKLTDGNDNSHA